MIHDRHNEISVIMMTAQNDVAGVIRAVLLHFDGSVWQEDNLSKLPLEASGGFASVRSFDSSNQIITLTAGYNVWKRRNREAWYRPLEPNHTNPAGQLMAIGIRGDRNNDLFAPGPNGYLAHWNGKTWHNYDEIYRPASSGYGAKAFSAKGNTFCIVGVNGGDSWVVIGQRKR